MLPVFFNFVPEFAFADLQRLGCGRLVSSVVAQLVGRGLPKHEEDRPPAGAGFIALPDRSGAGQKPFGRLQRSSHLDLPENSSASNLPFNRCPCIKQNPVFQKRRGSSAIWITLRGDYDSLTMSYTRTLVRILRTDKWLHAGVCLLTKYTNLGMFGSLGLQDTHIL